MTLQSSLVTAYQAAATADLAILNTLSTAEGGPFSTLQSAIATAAATLNDTARQAALNQIAQEIAQAKGDFLTLVSLTTAAQTGTPNI